MNDLQRRLARLERRTCKPADTAPDIDLDAAMAAFVEMRDEIGARPTPDMTPAEALRRFEEHRRRIARSR